MVRTAMAMIIFLPILLGGTPMAESSRPQPGRDTTYPNAGPYTADEWKELLGDMHLGDDSATKGPLGNVANYLEATNPAGVNIQVDTGRGMVNGAYYRNTSAITITPTTPAANPRIDRVVLVLNNTNAAISTQSPSGYTFQLDGGATSIPAYSVHVAIMKGTEAGAPVAPSLEQSGSRLWMVPLAQYQISTVPAVSNFTDQRDFVDAETFTEFVAFHGGYDATAAGELEFSTAYGFLLPQNNTTNAYAAWKLPTNYISDLTFTPVVVNPGAATGFYFVDLTASYGACGQAVATHSDASATLQVAEVATLFSWMCLTTISVTTTAEAAGDIFSLNFNRNGAHASDTAGNTIAVGVIVEYLGYKR